MILKKLTIAFVAVLIAFSTTVFPADDIVPGREPLVRIGLLRNSSVVNIRTRDTSLAGGELNGQVFNLATKTLRFSSRPYRTPKYGIYRFEIPGIETEEEANEMAATLKNEGNVDVEITSSDDETWKLRLDVEKESKEEADAFVAGLEEKGIIGIRTDVEYYTSPSDDAIALSRQIVQNPKSKVRSLSKNVGKPTISPLIKKTSLSREFRENMNVPVSSGLREVIVSGTNSLAPKKTLRPFVVGSANPRGIVYLNGKRYRGKMEVYVNSKGRLTVVNVVPMEDYLLGVVPAELSLPQIEAQKAQAVAARTYAAANKNDYGDEGFDMLPTVWSQVYKGVRIESRMGTRAVKETRGIVATHNGKPINAMYTSTCGGRTENSGNIYPFDEPYLRGVNCSLAGKEHFEPFLIKTTREPALIRNESNYYLVRLASRMAVNNFLIINNGFNDDYFDDAPSETELRSWLARVAVRFNKPFPAVTADSSKPLKLARILHGLIYPPQAEDDADTLLSESDINYYLSFKDGSEVPGEDRVILAKLLRDGWFSIHPDLTIKPNKAYSRAKVLRLIDHIYKKKKWGFEFRTGTAAPSEDGKLMIRKGRRSTEIQVSQQAYLFRKFGDQYYQVKEAALLGGEKVRYKTIGENNAVYIEIEPTEKTTVAERMSSFTSWSKRMTNSQMRATLGRYVRGLGALIDINIKSKGFSRRATELEIKTTRGIHSLKGGKIRSALRLREQLFVMKKRYASNGRVSSITFSGRGWGHGIGMCQYGAYGFAQMGLKFDRILHHYYTDIELKKYY